MTRITDQFIILITQCSNVGGGGHYSSIYHIAHTYNNKRLQVT